MDDIMRNSTRLVDCTRKLKAKESIIDGISDVLMLLDAKTYEILFVNRASQLDVAVVFAWQAGKPIGVRLILHNHLIFSLLRQTEALMCENLAKNSPSGLLISRTRDDDEDEDHAREAQSSSSLVLVLRPRLPRLRAPLT